MNSEKFAMYYQEHYPRLLRYFIYKTNNREAAEDLTQETFTYCFQNFENYDAEKSSFPTWLYLIANCRLKNFYRDEKNFVDFDQVSAVLPVDCITQVDQVLYLEYIREEVAQALLQLPENYRKVIVKKYFEQKDHRQIALEMGITEVNSRVLLTRAVKKFGLQIQHRIEEEN